MVWFNLFKLVFYLSIISLSVEQNARGGREGKKRRRQRDDVKVENSLTKALAINYPLRIFESNQIKNWREPATYSNNLAVLSKEKTYKSLSRAQDQEDVWLYENWFYGMENGVIMESGALNGILFSNSYMFEQFANWTAVHVGKYSYDHILFFCRRLLSAGFISMDTVSIKLSFYYIKYSI